MKLTKKRTQILDVIKKQKELCTAQELGAKVPDVDLATIYRNLDLFVQEGFVKKFSLGDGEARYEYNHGDNHHAVCSTCEQVMHFSAPDKKILEQLNIKDFDVTSIDIFVRGTCAQDNKKTKS